MSLHKLSIPTYMYTFLYMLHQTYEKKKKKKKNNNNNNNKLNLLHSDLHFPETEKETFAYYYTNNFQQ